MENPAVDQLEFEIVYTLSDSLSAEVISRRASKENKLPIVAAWILSAIVIFCYLIPSIAMKLMCLLFQNCLSTLYWEIAKEALYSFGWSAIFLIFAYTDLLFRLGHVVKYFLLTINPNREFNGQEKILFTIEKIEIERRFYKIIFEWDIFQKFLETKKAFLLFYDRNRYSLIPKHSFDDLDEVNAFIQLVISKTNLQLIKIK